MPAMRWPVPPPLVLCLLILGPTAEARTRLQVTAEAGPELDTNATRLHTVRTSEEKAMASGLLRVMARGSLTQTLGERQVIQLVYGGGGKVFWDGEAADTENELVQHGSLAYMLRLAPGLLWLQGDYYDAFQAESRRDFRSAQGALRLLVSHRPTTTQATLELGFRGLEYKPDSDRSDEDCLETADAACARYSSHGPQGGLGLSWTLTSGRDDEAVDWRIQVGYQGALRLFDSLPRGLRESCSDEVTAPAAICSYFKEGQRQDLNHQVRLQIDYQGNADFSLWYLAEVNQSNSFGASFTRHVVGMKFTADLALGVSMSVKGVLQLRRDQDPAFISLGDVAAERGLTFINIEEENRSSLMAQLARDVLDDFTVLLRYSLQVNEAVTASGEVASGPAYMRHTLFAGVRYEWDLAR